MLSGYKTYIVAALVTIIAIVEAAGIDIPGAEMQEDWINYVLLALGGAALRNGVSKNK